jgi:hypothetical protein
MDDVEVLDQIGGGGVGIVHSGLYKGRPVALKTLVSVRARCATRCRGVTFVPCFENTV